MAFQKLQNLTVPSQKTDFSQLSLPKVELDSLKLPAAGPGLANEVTEKLLKASIENGLKEGLREPSADEKAAVKTKKKAEAEKARKEAEEAERQRKHEFEMLAKARIEADKYRQQLEQKKFRNAEGNPEALKDTTPKA